jgi:hypothetical protein
MKCVVCEDCGWVCEHHRIDLSKASAPATAAARERRVHDAMRATMNRGPREASKPDSIRGDGATSNRGWKRKF